MGVATETQERVGTPPVPLVLPSPSADRPASRWKVMIAIAVIVSAAAVAIARAWPSLFVHATPPIVTASGRIEGREVTVAAKAIQGRITRLLADEGQTVTQGQLLAELDAAQLEAQYAAASGGVANVEAQIEQASLDLRYTAKNSAASVAAAEAALSSAQAHLLRVKAILANSTITYERLSSLLTAAAISKQELDQAEMSLRTSGADVSAAEKDVTRAEANVALAKASADMIGVKRQQIRVLQENRRSAAARLAEAQANLAERLIAAPSDGTIVSRPVEVGDVVSPGSPIFRLVDMRRLYVKVYIPGPEIAKLRLGAPADVFVDAFPKRSFAARITKISDQAEFTPKNVETTEERQKLVFGVELAFVNPDGLLKPGMPADCIIHWQPGVPNGRGDGS